MQRVSDRGACPSCGRLSLCHGISASHRLLLFPPVTTRWWADGCIMITTWCHTMMGNQASVCESELCINTPGQEQNIVSAFRCVCPALLHPCFQPEQCVSITERKNPRWTTDSDILELEMSHVFPIQHLITQHLHRMCACFMLLLSLQKFDFLKFGGNILLPWKPQVQSMGQPARAARSQEFGNSPWELVGIYGNYRELTRTNWKCTKVTVSLRQGT